MKKIIIVFIASLSTTFATKAQDTKFSVPEFSKKLGKTATLCDTVYSLKIVNDTLTLLNMGGVYPNQKYTVAVRGNKVNLNWAILKGKPLCVTGVFIMYKERPEIEVTEPDQINVGK